MANIDKIIKAIDEFLEKRNQTTTTPPEINPYLEKKGILNDSKSRSGNPIRNLLRNGEIPHAYQSGVNWFIPKSGNSSIKLKPKNNVEAKNTDKPSKEEISKDNKLTPIGNLILKLIEKKYKQRPEIFYEYKPEWLLSNPIETLIEKRSELCVLYKALRDGGEYSLKDIVGELTPKQLNQKQSFDIWIGEPFNFAIEFDESQHFNQFRKITLDYYTK